MTEPSVRNMRLLQTYLWHPENQVGKHVLVNTSKHEGYKPVDNYDEHTETMAFETWVVDTNPSGILERRDRSKGIYQQHNDVVGEFLSQGYKKLKTFVRIIPEGFNPKVVTYQLRLDKFINPIIRRPPTA